MPFDQLPAWVNAWSRIDPTLLSVADVNKDNILQLNEMTIGGDIIVLLTPELAGLPYVISGLVAAGGLAAALSTALSGFKAPPAEITAASIAASRAFMEAHFHGNIAPTGALGDVRSTARRCAVGEAIFLTRPVWQ